MDFAQSEKLITIVRIPRHQGRLRNREMITALEPLIIMDDDHVRHSWFDNAEHVPRTWLLGNSPNG
jgi:hypothetical protein